MLSLHGQVLNVYQTPEGTDRETGNKYGGQWKVQLQVEELLKNGEKRFSVQTLTTENPDQFRGLEGKPVSVPVGVIASNNGKNIPVRFFMGKGDIQSETQKGVNLVK
jgi:hypothetical protein